MAFAVSVVVLGVLSAAEQTPGRVAGLIPGSVTEMVLGALGAAAVDAAETVSRTALAALDSTTGVDLTAAWFRDNLAVMAAVTLPVVVGLFAVQVIGSVLRREPGGLLRGVAGVGKATLGSVLAIAGTQLALLATDEVCAVIASSAGTSVQGAAARFLRLTWLAGPQAGVVLQVLLGIAVIVGSILLWAVLLFRAAAVLLVAIFAPIAFAGSVWDQTRVWTRRWIEAMAALVFCKIVIVVVFVVGVSAFGSSGTTTPAGGAAQSGLSDLLVGLILLSIAVFAPWLTWRFVHWSGMEAASVLTGTLAATPVPNAARSTAMQARFMAQSLATTALLRGAGGAVGGGAPSAGGAGGPRVLAVPPTPRPSDPRLTGGGAVSAPVRPDIPPAGPRGGDPR